jgi:hypothetical protein
MEKEVYNETQIDALAAAYKLKEEKQNILNYLVAILFLI